MTEEKSLAVIPGSLGDFDSSSFAGALEEPGTTKGSATGEAIREAMGNQTPKLPRLKVKHGGAAIFTKADGTRLEKVEGVIVAHTFHNSWFSKSFEEQEQGERPACFSNDAVTVAERAEDPQATGCAACPRNRDARDKEAREAAFDRDRKECCNNYISLAVSIPGEEVPYVVQLSSTSFKAWAGFIQEIGAKGRYLAHEVGMRLTLANQRGAGGSEFSVAKFEFLGALPEKLRPGFAEAHRNYTSLLRRAAGDEPGSGSEQREAAEAIEQAKKAEAAAAAKPAAL